jgi:hypothetical protein
MLAAMAEQPADLPVLTAPHRAIRYGLAQLERHDEQERRELIAAVPELRIAQLDDIRRTVELLAGAVAGRLGRPPGDFEIRVFTGALTGAVLAALDDDAQDAARLDNIRQAIDYLGTGFPLAAVSGRLQGLITHNETGASQPITVTRLDSGTPWPSLPDVCRRLRAGQLWYECETTGWLGLADEIPLTEVAAELGQQLQGGGVLNSFGHDAQTEGVAEVDGRANEVEGASTVAVGEPSDEDSIEFEFLHRQAAEVGE